MLGLDCQANQRSSSRRGLYPCLGQLYPEGIKLLSKVDTEDKLGRLLDKFPDYRHLWESAPLDEVRVAVLLPCCCRVGDSSP